MTIAVRPADSGDIPWVLGQLPAADLEVGCGLHGPPDYVADRVVAWIGEGASFVATDVNGHVGFIVGTLHPHLFNPDKLFLTSLLWWVTPESRGSRAAALLMAAFIAYGRHPAHGINVGLQAETPINPDHLLHRGFRLKECSYLLEVA